jgi:uncharacterized protein (TIGR03067 family)
VWRAPVTSVFGGQMAKLIREDTMRMEPLSRWVVLVGMVIGADCCFADPPRSDAVGREAKAELAKWAGAWTGPRGDTLTIDGDRFVTATLGDGSFRGSIRVIEVGRDAVKADLRIEEDGYEVIVVPAIFRLDGDTLHYCGNDPGQPRPTEFKSNGTKYCVAWKRAKK